MKYIKKYDKYKSLKPYKYLALHFQSNATSVCLFVHYPRRVCVTMMFMCSHNWHKKLGAAFQWHARVIATTITWLSNFFSTRMETSVKFHLTVRSPISSSFNTRGKELSLTCASSRKIIGGSDESARWMGPFKPFGSSTLSPNLHKWAWSQLSFRASVYLSSKTSSFYPAFIQHKCAVTAVQRWPTTVCIP